MGHSGRVPFHHAALERCPPGLPRPTDPSPALSPRLPSESTPLPLQGHKTKPTCGRVSRHRTAAGPAANPRPFASLHPRTQSGSSPSPLPPPPSGPRWGGRGAERAAGAAPRGGSGAGRGGRLGPAGGDSAAAPLRSGAAAGRRWSAAAAGGRRRLLHARCAGGRGACAGREGPAALRASPGASWISYFLIATFSPF